MEPETIYCRKCQKQLPIKRFYEAVDGGMIDGNGYLSVCRDCINILYDKFYSEMGSFEKALHRLCTSLNVRYSNDAAEATKINIETLKDNGKNIASIFGIYKSKLVATKKSMDKSGGEAMTYEDVSTIFTTASFDVKEVAIPQEVITFWGSDISKEDTLYLEKEYRDFKSTHKADSHAEVTLLKQVCYTLLNIKKARVADDDTSKMVKELQDLMRNLAISPNATNASLGDKGADAFGVWIQDIEKSEPAQWLKSDPRGDMYRDIADVEGYFQKYIVRPLKNFILASKDFNVDDETSIDMEEAEIDEAVNFNLIDDGEVVE